MGETAFCGIKWPPQHEGMIYHFGIHKGNNKAVLRVTLNSTAFNLQWVPFKELYIRSNHGKIFSFMFLPVRESERHYNFILFNIMTGIRNALEIVFHNYEYCPKQIIVFQHTLYLSLG